jgi:hypothetical protein
MPRQKLRAHAASWGTDDAWDTQLVATLTLYGLGVISGYSLGEYVPEKSSHAKGTLLSLWHHGRLPTGGTYEALTIRVRVPWKESRRSSP